MTGGADTIFARTPPRSSDTLQLTAQAFGRTDQLRTDVPFTFRSSDTSVAVVDTKGVVHARGRGTARITVSTCGREASRTVVVAPLIATITISPDTVTALAGDTIPVRASAHDQHGRPVPDVRFTFGVSDSSRARVTQTSDTTAQVIFLQAGTVKVTATAEGQTATASTATALPRALVQLDVGDNSACGLAPLGRGYCWGLGDAGQLGTLGDSVCFGDVTGATYACSLSPKPLDRTIAFAAVSVGDSLACAISTAGAAYCWGDNTYGQLGNGKRGQPGPVPSTVYSTQTFTTVTAGGRHACGLATGGIAYCWGEDSLGQLGDARAINSTTPIPVIGVQVFSAVSAGYRHTCGIAGTAPGTAGAAYCWGANADGELGSASGETCQLGPPKQPVFVPCSSVPLAVGGGLTFTAVSAGRTHTCAIASGGAAYCWGANDVGEAGIGSTGGPIGQPSAVTGGLTFSAISAGSGYTCGLTTAGAAYCWGSNVDGQLGTGTVGGTVATPTAVTGGLTFSSISAGLRQTCGLATDGNAYCWGSNVFGALGNELQAAVRGAPVRVATLR